MNKFMEQLLKRFPELIFCQNDIEKAFEALKELYDNDGICYVAGNGGSASDAEHIVGELMKGFLLKRRLQEEEVDKFGIEKKLAMGLQKGLRAYALTSHPALVDCFCQ